MFLGIIALLKNAGVVVAHPVTLVAMGDMTRLTVILALAGFVVIVALDALKVPGAIMIGILAITIIAVATGVSDYKGIVDLPPDPSPVLFATGYSARRSMSPWSP